MQEWTKYHACQAHPSKHSESHDTSAQKLREKIAGISLYLRDHSQITVASCTLVLPSVMLFGLPKEHTCF